MTRIELFVANHRFIHLIGGGGKTSLMFALARDLVAAGRAVITTTTTRILRPSGAESPRVLLGATTVDVITRALAAHRHVTLALAEDQQPGKLLGHAPEYLADLARHLDAALLVEADGSAGRPLKAHAEHEPVIAAEADGVILVVGADAIGARLSPEVAHRAALLAERFSLDDGEALTPELIARVLRDDYLRAVPSAAAVTTWISRAKFPAQRARAVALAQVLRRTPRLARVVIGDLFAGELELAA